ncbi:VOC family protein [Raineyella fluvialis]|uniref:VOC family protein n=1 Tax=Raineyella fluvialis TaxID=2662261 RepID=A0A5Q2FFI8_9ACTN|nr:VOC family protein [Raineyella fluvialis]QGF23455.1 VOC family protein [Raineyella fluvialis]
MRTLHTAYRVTDLDASMGFYRELGYREIGRGEMADGTILVVLKFPGEDVGSLELLYRPSDGPVDLGTGFHHLVVQVHDLDASIAALTLAGRRPSAAERPGGPDGPRTSMVADPDGYLIELVEWPRGHPDGLTVEDFRS